MPEAMIVTNGMLASSGRFVMWTTASATRNPASGELRGQKEMEGIAKECLASVIGEGNEDVVKEIKPNSRLVVRSIICGFQIHFHLSESSPHRSQFL